MASGFSRAQARFADAVLDAAAPPPSEMVTQGVLERRFAVYRNNVVVGLIEALSTRFPATRRIVGEAFFKGMARVYVETHPPRSPLMMQYGESFPEFVAGFEPAAGIRYLSDVAWLEVARGRAYHAAEAPPLPATAWAEPAPDALAVATLRLHPSLSVIASVHPVFTIWEMNQPGHTPHAIHDWSAEAAVVVRPKARVRVLRLPGGAAGFLAALADGRSLGQAADAARRAHNAFDLTAAVAMLIQGGLATSLNIPEKEGAP